MKYFFLLIFCLIINMELADSQELKAYYFDSGKKDTISVSKSLKAKIIKQIEKLIYNIDQELRVYFDAGRIDELKKTEKSIELIFNKKNKIKSKSRGVFTVQKILLPLTGDLSGSKEANTVSILVGGDEYDSSPYLVKDGYVVVQHIEKILLKKKGDK
jgi:hypothetical protein